MFRLLLSLVTITVVSSGLAYADDTIESLLPSVVRVGVSTTPDPMLNVQTIGSGVVVDSSGYILTAKHVVDQFMRVFVQIYTGELLPVQYMILDGQRDLALLKVEFPDHTIIPGVAIGDDREVMIGERLFALGFPSDSTIRGQYATVTSGVLSARGRWLLSSSPSQDDAESSTALFHGLMTRTFPRVMEDVKPQFLLQMDVPINPGSSGGPVVTAEGILIGLSYAVVTSVGHSGSVGLNFALAITDAKPIIELIRKLEAVTNVGVDTGNRGVGIRNSDEDGQRVRDIPQYDPLDSEPQLPTSRSR